MVNFLFFFHHLLQLLHSSRFCRAVQVKPLGAVVLELLIQRGGYLLEFGR